MFSMICINRRTPVAALSINLACVFIATRVSAENDPAIISSDAKIEKLWGDGFFTEGSAGKIYFVDYPFGETPGRVLKFDPMTGRTTVYSADRWQGERHDV